MKKRPSFWKVMLIVLPLTMSAIFGILAWKLYQRVYGRDYTERYSYGLDKVYYQNNKVRILNTQTMRFTTPRLNWITDYKEIDSLTVFCYEGKRGYLSLYDGKITIPAQFQAAWMFSEGLGAVIKDNKLGFINSSGKVVIPFKFHFNPLSDIKVDYLFKDGICSAKDVKGKMGLINKKGEWVVQPQYDYIRNPVNGYRIVTKGSKVGLLDSLLRIKLPIDYDAITIEKDGFVISKDGLQQKLATDAQSIINPFMYDEVDYLHFNSGKVTAEGEDILVKSDYFAYTINEKYGLMDSKGKMILRAKFDDINALTNDLFSCKIGEHQITMNSKGEEISK